MSPSRVWEEWSEFTMSKSPTDLTREAWVSGMNARILVHQPCTTYLMSVMNSIGCWRKDIGTSSVLRLILTITVFSSWEQQAPWVSCSLTMTRLQRLKSSWMEDRTGGAGNDVAHRIAFASNPGATRVRGLREQRIPQCQHGFWRRGGFLFLAGYW